ncbi:MAG: HDOD domain-containing protein [Planctomycetes bacterium]|nr:HDOD domain-containing protein [Planctomycetota bacterium]
MSQHKLLLARQPSLDREQRVAGYEILFRQGGDEFARVDCDSSATSEVIARALIDVGLDALIGASRAWINVPRDFLIERRFALLPPKRVVIEVLESVTAESAVIDALREARALGFTIALDDYEEDEHNTDLIPECDVIKIDCLGRDEANIARVGERLRPTGRRMLAEKVETSEMHAACKGAGFQLFQGYYFARPSPVHAKQVQSDHGRIMLLLAELNDPETSMQRVAELVQSDVALSYRLMRYANSAFLGRSVRFTSLRDVINMLGVDRVRACATLLALGAGSSKPAELGVTALIRARYCQLLGSRRGGNPQEYFVVGLFSVLDAFLDEPMERVAPKLPLAKDITAALVDRSGSLGEVLDAALCCERAEWGGEALRGFDTQELSESYLAALAWANQVQGAIADG